MDGKKQISAKTIVFDLAALAMSSETARNAALTELEKDGFDLICWSALSRKRTFSALLKLHAGEYFDEIVFLERAAGYDSKDLLRLRDSYWIRQPKDYEEIMNDTGQRRARLPLWLQYKW